MNTDHSKNRSAFKILVVEDNILDFELMEAALSAVLPCDIKLTMTKTGFENELVQNQPDLIVSDSNIVAFDGFTALKIAHEKCPDVPFVFCSGAAPDHRLKHAPGRPAGWVSKDNGFAGLVAFVKKVLDSREGG
jgi:CheY-like chemotaxis protein